jgi:ABC-type multidrug transport system ATPase subunit
MPSPATPREDALSARAISKSYGRAPVLAGIDLAVPGGAAFGLVGLNGAGKTTLIKCMLDFCAVDQGSFEIFGISSRAPAARARLSYVPENFVPPHYLTCREFIELTTSIAGERVGPRRVELVMDELRLDPASLDRPVRQLSKGMTQKLGLAACFLVERDLYVLDEPMSGLDPASRVAVKSVLSRLTREGRTLFFTSHVLSDVEELCSSIAVLDRGRIRFNGPPRQLCGAYDETNLERAFMRCINVIEPPNIA